MTFFAFGLVLLSAATFTPDAIPAGTVLPAQLNSALNSRKVKAGQVITARLMEDVPLRSGRSLPAGAKLVGTVVDVNPSLNQGPSQVTFRFDQILYRHSSQTITASLRSLASMLEVEYAQIPPMSTDRGTPWSWATRVLVGGAVSYGEGGPVVRFSTVTAHIFAFVTGPASAFNCRGESVSGEPLYAIWVFSSDSCGAYGFSRLEILHDGRIDPKGQVTLTSDRGDVNVRAGSGLLLITRANNQESRP